MKTYRSRLAGSTELRAECRTARWRHVTVGLIGYGLPIVLLALGVSVGAESAGVDLPRWSSLVVIGVLLGVVLWRGATISAVVGSDGLLVRNRWRRLVVPWSEITEAEVGSSMPYFWLDLIDSIRQIDESTGMTAEEEMQFSDVLLISRRGRRRRLPAYATLGLTRHPAEMQAFLDALAARGVRVTRERPSPGVSPVV